MIETHKLLVLSTGHLTSPETRATLDAGFDQWPCSGGRTAYGWFCYAHDENCGDTIPPDLWACMVFARTAGCQYILFDMDAEQIDALPWVEF